MTIGTTYLNMALFNQALECFMQALKIYENIGDKRGIAGLYINIGLVCSKISDREKALEYYSKAMRTLKEVNDKRSLAILYNNIGSIYNDSKEHKTALEYFRKALEIKKKIGEKFRIAHTLTNIGTVYMDTENYEKSLEYFFQSLNIQEEIGDEYASVETLRNIGYSYASTDRIAEAVKYIQQGLSIAKALKVPDLIMSCYESFSAIYKKKKDFKKAFEYYKQFKKLDDEIFTKENSRKFNELQISYETEKKEKESEIYRLRNIELVKTNENLTKALAEIKTLSGLLPICSSCKKIRDDSGYWEQIEEYIAERSDTQFSHGICPECEKNLLILN